jgi:hypothetical protein
MKIVSLKTKILVISALVIVFMALAYGKVTIEAQGEYKRALKALEEDNTQEAITHFNRAIHWYAPGSSATKDSIANLWKIGNLAEDSQDYGLALRAYRELRSSLYSVRSFYTPHTEWIEKCDERIASIIAEGKAPSPEGRSAPTASKEEVLEILRIKTEPDYFWSIICEVGFVGWIACTVGFIFFVFTGGRGFRAKRALVWGTLIIIFYAVWIVGMLRA